VIDEINLDAFVLHEREGICGQCHTVHWMPTGQSFCD